MRWYLGAVCMQVPVTSHQTYKSDMLNNPDVPNNLWFPEKPRSANIGSKYPATQKRAADNKLMGLTLDRLQADSSAKSNGSTPSGATSGARTLVCIGTCITPVRPLANLASVHAIE